MMIEVTPVVGRDPDPGALQLLVQRVNEHCNKPGGVQIVIDPDVPEDASAGGAPPQRTVADLAAFEAAHRKLYSTQSQVVLYVEYVDGFLASPPNVLGAAYASTSIAVFKDELESAFGSSESDLEGRVLVHELGHELGLVNEGTPMVADHEDTVHPPHCTDPNCVMFWTLHGAVSPDAPLPAADFDSQCIADLVAAGGH